MEGWAIVALTAVLVVVTWLYQRDTHRMAVEMRRARGSQVLPRIVLAVNHRGGGAGFWRVASVGAGPALGVDVAVTPEPDGEPRHFTMPVMAPGEAHDLIPLEDPKEQRSDFLRLDQTTARFSRLRLTGRCRDVLGEEHVIDETFEIREWWETMKKAQILLPRDLPEEMARSLEKIEKDLKTISKDLHSRSTTL
jgi:hypothetical protein